MIDFNNKPIWILPEMLLKVHQDTFARINVKCVWKGTSLYEEKEVLGSSVHLWILLEKVVEGFCFCFLFTRKWIKYFHRNKIVLWWNLPPPQEKGDQKASDEETRGSVTNCNSKTNSRRQRGPSSSYRTQNVCHLVGEDRAGGEGRAEHSDGKTKEILAQRHWVKFLPDKEKRSMYQQD